MRLPTIDFKTPGLKSQKPNSMINEKQKCSAFNLKCCDAFRLCISAEIER